MKAYLKNGTVAEIETKHLFFNQYNTTDGKRIFDNEIERIEDDARVNMGVCKYCGAMVKKGEEEKHFQERESKGCAGCFWQRERQEGETITKKQAAEKNGEKVVKITETRTYKKVCTYHECHSSKTNCTNTECRAYGIKWFTPENTFFLKYPGGFKKMPLDSLTLRGFGIDPHCIHAQYFKKLGSYTLTALLKYENGVPVGVECYRIYNCRKDYHFRYENGELFTDKYSFGWVQVKTLEGIPENVMQAISNICNN